MKRHFIIFLFLLIIVFFTIGNYVYLQRIDLFNDKDEAYHALLCSEIFQAIVHKKADLSLLYDVNWPRGFHMVAVTVRFLLGDAFIFMTPTLFLILLLWSVYKIGAHLRNETTGLASALIVGLYPWIYVSSCHFDYEMAQAAMTALIVYLLLDSRRFSSLAYSVFFGIVLAYGLIIKQSVVLFVGGPLYISMHSLLKNIPRNSVKIRNVCYGLIICFCIAFIGYYRVYFDYPNMLHETIFARFFHKDLYGLTPIVPYSWSQLSYYLPVLKDFQITIVGIALFFIGLPFFIRHKDVKTQLILFSWFIVPFFVLSIATLKAPHYSIAYLPVFAVISAVGVSYIPREGLRKMIIGIFIIWGLLSYVCHTLNIFPKVKVFLRSNKLFFSDWVPETSQWSNPVYSTAKYISTVHGNRPCSIGILYYPCAESENGWFAVCLASLLKLNNPYYNVVDILPVENIDMTGFDYLVFIRGGANNDAWINYDAFVRFMGQVNKANALRGQYFIQYIMDNRQERPDDAFHISSTTIRTIEKYFPNLHLMQTIKGKSAECLIYQQNDISADPGDARSA